jgi:hypothetical protein
MPRDTDRPDPYIAAPLGPPIRQAAPAPVPAPLKAPQPMQMDMADVPMIIRDCYAKPSKLNEQQRADWLRMSAEPALELHPRRHLDWPVIDPDMIEQAPRRRAAWLPERD